jgi:hypothetical protein
VEFLWALLGAAALVCVIHFGMLAYDCNQSGGTLVKAVMPFEFVCINTQR